MTEVQTTLQAISVETVGYLESLAAALPAEDYHAHLVVADGRRPSLHVRNRSAGVLAEDVLVEAGWFWYSFAERIAPVTDVSAAAGKIARLLRTVDTD
jgi:hypothetical protein